jgi:hypothetical protein
MSALPPKADIQMAVVKRLLLTRSEHQLAFRKTSLLILDNFDGALLGGFFDFVLEVRQVHALYNGICTDNLKDLWTCAFRKTTGDTSFFDPNTFYSHFSQSLRRVDSFCPDIPQMPPQTGPDDSRG